MIIMAKKPSRTSKKVESFNRSQEIYKLLEKGIIESEALMGSALDRPEDDAHITELLESATDVDKQQRKSKPSGSAPKRRKG